MIRHRTAAFLALALTVILSSFAASAQQTRALPPNDNIASAKAIKIGKNYSVPDIGAATNEAGEPTASCKSAAVIPNSVWFSLSQPIESVIYLSTFGSELIRTEASTEDTVLAVYEQTSPGVFAEVACNDDGNSMAYSQLTFRADAGETYFIAVGTFLNAVDFQPESTVKLITRMLYTEPAMPNASFETPISAATDWKLTNGGDDGRVCSNPTYPAPDGLCTFRFTGTPGITTKLTQVMPFPTTFLPRKDARLEANFYYRVMDTAALGTAKVKFVVTYSDGTPASVLTVNLTGKAAGGNTNRQSSIVLKSAKVASAKVDVKFASPAGTLLFDAVVLIYGADVTTRGADGLLPLPPAAGEKQ